jgi:flagellar export protein FliJ
MKNLDNLIRLHQWRLDEKRRKVVELERLVLRLRAEIELLEKNLKVEQQVAAQNAEAATGYGSYVSAVIARREKLKQSLAGLESEMTQATEDVAVAFREFKKFDLMRTRNQEKARLQKKRLQQKEIDEAGLNVYRRASTR